LGPSLLGVYGQPVKLTTGESVTADDAYMRESILLPKAKIVAGYSPIMPSFQGQMTEEQVTNVVAYLRALGKAQPKPKEEGKQ
jgi:cytochrome c oxidase subunit 2